MQLTATRSKQGLHRDRKLSSDAWLALPQPMGQRTRLVEMAVWPLTMSHKCSKASVPMLPKLAYKSGRIILKKRVTWKYQKNNHKVPAAIDLHEYKLYLDAAETVECLRFKQSE